MLDKLVVIHHCGLDGSKAPGTGSELPETWIHWKTCLRHISLRFLEPFETLAPVSEGSKVFLGIKAYEFLLEVVCGLHSPIAGETEVMGQFRELLEATSLKKSPQLHRLFTKILTDAKIIRQNCLRGMGSRSYGSLIRRHIKSSKHVTVLGSGKLAGDILPWLKNTQDVNIVCRNPVKGEALKKECDLDFVKVHDMSALDFGDTLVVAASMPTDELRKYLLGREAIQKIIDLREESTRDPLGLGLPTLTLRELFGEIQSVQSDVQMKLNAAKEMINNLSDKYFKAAELRPFGWEDLCG